MTPFRWRGPFSACSRRAVTAWAVSFFAMTAIMATIGTPLKADGGASIKDFELAGTAARAQAILEGWNLTQALVAAFHTGIDYLYIPIYVIALSAWTSHLATAVRTPWARVIGWTLAWLLPAAGILDAIEDAALMAQLVAGAKDRLALTARYAALVKFAIAYGAALYILLAGGSLIATTVLGARKAWPP